MSRFIQNLIVRQQSEQTNAVETHIVQPRPRARFEKETNSPEFTNTETASSAEKRQHDDSNPRSESDLSQIHSDHSLNADSRVHATQLSSIPSLMNTTPSEAPGEPTTIHPQQRIDEFKIPFDKNTSAIEMPESLVANRPPQPGIKEVEITTDSRQANTSPLILPDELNQRIQAMLENILHEQTQEGTQQNESDPLLTTTAANEPNNLLPEADLAGHTAAIQSVETQNQSKQQELGSLEPRAGSPNGLLQTPAWVAKMQSDLNSQWQEEKAPQAAEPVINVSIGRIEVRAHTAEPEKQTNKPSKPSGVMSLDDYLKQRENRGRA